MCDEWKWNQKWDNVVLSLDNLVLLSIYSLYLHVFSFDISIFIIHPKMTVGKKCKLGILAPRFQVIQYTIVSLYEPSPLPEDNVEVSP